jgi:hypothetical protein
MTAKQRSLSKRFTQTYTTNYKKLLVSGCSFTWNNSEEHICSWPYYLRDIAGFDLVFDCSQSGAGSNHIFNSIINEIETNPEVSSADTLIVIMWSGLTRTDVISTTDITKPWHFMSNYHFNDEFSTLTIFNNANGKTLLDNLCRQYKQLVDPNAQIYESLLKIIALDAYLKQKDFEYIFVSWRDPNMDVDHINSPLVNTVNSLLDPVRYLGEYAETNQLQETCGHPTPTGYLGWTRECLIPYLIDRAICIPVK